MSEKITIIKPPKKIDFIDLKELWRFRELFFTLVERDIKVRYKQTVIGGLWAIVQPLTTMVVFSFFFGKIAKIPSEGVPYPIFSYSGLLLWTYFSGAVGSASSSLIGSANLITKVYFPRIIIPLAATMVGLVDYIIAGTIMVGLMAYYHIYPQWNILFLPLIVLLTWMLASGVGFWLSATNVIFRDVKYIIGFLLQLWIYATPVIYPTSVSGQFQWLVALNPMSGLIEAHRGLILGYQNINLSMLSTSIAMTIIIFITGLIYFKSIERKFADII